jgi:hypothetical protein
MLEQERKLVDQISGQLAKWEAGELVYAWEHKRLGFAILNYLENKKKWVDRLRAMPWSEKVDAELDLPSANTTQ